MDAKNYLTVQQIAEELNFSARTVRSWIRAGTLVSTQPGPRSTRVSRDDLTAFLTKFRITPRAAWITNQAAPCRPAL